MIEFVTASHDREVLQKNLLSSPVIEKYGVVVQENYTNVSKAYNEARITEEIVAYIHHDVLLPRSFEWQLKLSLKWIDKLDRDWAVLGVAGVKLKDGKRTIHGNILDRGREWGSQLEIPTEVDTLDELLLITKGDFKFDEQLDLHFYGADICMQARAQGRKNYAIQAFCHHNSTLAIGHRSESFKRCGQYFREKWINQLPIATTCIILS
ncbi:MAG TPA: glycosyltransferase [Chitinophagaceae bacterium]|nr:glycosyltransferase [Chitinophagaceae bacterium]